MHHYLLSCFFCLSFGSLVVNDLVPLSSVYVHNKYLVYAEDQRFELCKHEQQLLRFGEGTATDPFGALLVNSVNESSTFKLEETCSEEFLLRSDKDHFAWVKILGYQPSSALYSISIDEVLCRLLCKDTCYPEARTPCFIENLTTIPLNLAAQGTFITPNILEENTSTMIDSQSTIMQEEAKHGQDFPTFIKPPPEDHVPMGFSPCSEGSYKRPEDVPDGLLGSLEHPYNLMSRRAERGVGEFSKSHCGDVYSFWSSRTTSAVYAAVTGHDAAEGSSVEIVIPSSLCSLVCGQECFEGFISPCSNIESEYVFTQSTSTSTTTRQETVTTTVATTSTLEVGQVSMYLDVLAFGSCTAKTSTCQNSNVATNDSCGESIENACPAVIAGEAEPLIGLECGSIWKVKLHQDIGMETYIHLISFNPSLIPSFERRVKISHKGYRRICPLTCGFTSVCATSCNSDEKVNDDICECACFKDIDEVFQTPRNDDQQVMLENDGDEDDPVCFERCAEEEMVALCSSCVSMPSGAFGADFGREGYGILVSDAKEEDDISVVPEFSLRVAGLLAFW